MESKRYLGLIFLALAVLTIIFAIFFYNALTLRKSCSNFFYKVIEIEATKLKREIEKSQDPGKVIKRYLETSPVLKAVSMVFSGHKVLMEGSSVPEKYITKNIKVDSTIYELYFDAYPLFLVRRHLYIGFLLLFFTSMAGASLSGFLLMRYYREKLTLEKERAEAERAQSISLAISAVLHEVKNIVNNISLLVYKLKRECSSRELSLLYEELRRLSLYMEEVSDLRSPLTLKREKLSIKGLIESVLSEFEDILTLLDIKTEVNVEDTVLLLDPHRIRVAIRNLIKNAVEALSSVKERKLKIEGKVNADFYSLKVADSALALSPSKVDSLFLPYKTEGKKGFGVGLFNVKRIVEAHGGSVSLEIKGGYTTFLLKIPLERGSRS